LTSSSPEKWSFALQSGDLAFVTAADISDRVEMNIHAGRSHPAKKQTSRSAVLGRQEYARRVLRRLRDRRQFVDPAGDFIAEGWASARRARLLHLAHAFPMTKPRPPADR
jgi:hypothetical protein